ncbi:hypothetical protein CKO28_10355 [Rhodovibrio sodomensis]|uniref:Response regulatory domain-containing protein n=1 Tax=Rhodovibrio sodomensis TaxID=1088 RepID=A0ABS1DER5_9PROT|nr:response regulator [Rhodovibrio sodomensis]MBK1668436.1 hypothetical protein [Rhodovibrio sodomensis]
MATQAHPHRFALVLVVDDDDLVRDMVAASLTRAGYRVVLAADGSAAIDQLGARTPDLILTDLFMPNCDGIELLRSGLLRTSDIPVIAMSGGYAGIDLLGASRTLGATATIAKPFLPGELIDLVRGTLDPDAAASADRASTAGPGLGRPGRGGKAAADCH